MQDYSDPDVIRVNDDYFMVASSFNQIPGLPILHSKNLVDWRLVNYVYDKLPSPYYDTVRHGDGSWAPSLRYHDGIYYCMIPMPDDGIYLSTTKDIFGKWSPLKLVIKKRGLEDPCPIWIGDKAYCAVGFAKSRAGFNSCIGLYEMKPDLSENIGDYEIIYDGHDMNPTIEGPKFNERNGYYYIMAPAGSVKGGWQTALRSKSIHGPYEAKVVLFQGDTLVNGPHQGALIDMGNDKWSFIHFQDMRAYGRIVHLEPVIWKNDWPLCGNVSDELLCGTPVAEADYPVDISFEGNMELSDSLDGSMSLHWQTPANRNDSWYEFNNGLSLNCVNGIKPLNMQENHFLLKVPALSFDVSVKVSLSLNDFDEAGISMMGQKYRYLSISRRDSNYYLSIKGGEFKSEDYLIHEELIQGNSFELNIFAQNSNIYDLNYAFGINGKIISDYFKASAGRWIGAKIGIFARGNNGGRAVFKDFIVTSKN